MLLIVCIFCKGTGFRTALICCHIRINKVIGCFTDSIYIHEFWEFWRQFHLLESFVHIAPLKGKSSQLSIELKIEWKIAFQSSYSFPHVGGIFPGVYAPWRNSTSTILISTSENFGCITFSSYASVPLTSLSGRALCDSLGLSNCGSLGLPSETCKI